MSTTRIQTHGLSSRIRAALRALRRNRRGAATVEYIALVALLALGTLAMVKSIRDKVNEVGNKTAEGIVDFKGNDAFKGP